MMRDVKRPYHKTYQPVGFDLFDPKVHKGEAIEPGAKVRVTAHFGPFRYVTDDQGNEMSVGTGSLAPTTERTRRSR